AVEAARRDRRRARHARPVHGRGRRCTDDLPRQRRRSGRVEPLEDDAPDHSVDASRGERGVDVAVVDRAGRGRLPGGLPRMVDLAPADYGMSGIAWTVPSALWLLLAMPLVWIAHLAARTNFNPRQRRLQATVRSLIVGLLALALARPVISSRSSHE